MKKPKIITAGIVVALVLFLLWQNRHDVTLTLLFWEIIVPQIILIPLLLLVGFVAGYAVARMTGSRKDIP